MTSDDDHTDDEATTPNGATARDGWGVDAAIGAASIAARTASEVAGAVSGTGPAKVFDQAARWIARPLSREGQEVRERIGTEGVPAAQEAIRHATPGVVQAIDINEILAAIDLDALLDRIDVNRLVDRIDVSAIVAKVDVNELVQHVDVQSIVSRVDIDEIVSRVDIDSLLGAVDIDALLSRIDVGSLLERIDLDALLQSVDLDALLSRLDLDHLLGSVDLNALLSRLDINALMDRLDMDALVANTELGGIIARSTSGVASEALDVVRSQGVGVHNFIARVVNRAMRREQSELPPGPPLLIDAQLALPSPERIAVPAASPEAAADVTAIEVTAVGEP